jgi:hypothetical protein
MSDCGLARKSCIAFAAAASASGGSCACCSASIRLDVHTSSSSPWTSSTSEPDELSCGGDAVIGSNVSAVQAWPGSAGDMAVPCAAELPSSEDTSKCDPLEEPSSREKMRVAFSSLVLCTSSPSCEHKSRSSAALSRLSFGSVHGSATKRPMTPFGDCALTCALLGGASRPASVNAGSTPAGAVASWTALRAVGEQPTTPSGVAVASCARPVRKLSLRLQNHVVSTFVQATRRLDMHLLAVPQTL